ncbi:UNVERIFIED_CONTAM: Pre-splicing factor CLF1, partial [Sesamum latifolium]
MAAQFEIRQLNIDRARRILGSAIGMAPKDKICKKYVEIELQFGNIERCRKQLYEKYLEWSPHNCYAWSKFAELGRSLAETERARAPFELANDQPALNMPELLWKAYIDFEISEAEYERIRALYERRLNRTKPFEGSSLVSNVVMPPCYCFTYAEETINLIQWLEMGQIDSIFSINYTDPWIEGDDKRTPRAIMIQNTRNACSWKLAYNNSLTIGHITSGIEYGQPFRPKWNGTAGVIFQVCDVRLVCTLDIEQWVNGYLIRPTSPKSPIACGSAFESLEGSDDEYNVPELLFIVCKETHELSFHVDAPKSFSNRERMNVACGIGRDGQQKVKNPKEEGQVEKCYS